MPDNISAKSSFANGSKMVQLRRFISAAETDAKPAEKASGKDEDSMFLKKSGGMQTTWPRPPSRNGSPTKPLSKSMAVRSRPRPSLGAFRRTSDTQSAKTQKDEPVEEAATTNPHTLETKAKKVPRSSLSLRETIAMAKKAARKSNVGADGAALEDDPFSQLPRDGNKGLLRKRVEGARTSGHLNVAAMGFKDIPDEVMNMYNFNPKASSEWYQSVDLTKFIAADNEMETIRDDAFPDHGPEDSEDSKGNQFGGLETLDLHGNLLRMLPVGLRRLQRLRVLNLSNNKLDPDAFQIICELKGLTELKIANNAIGGALPDTIGQLKKLEVLDARGNFFEELPESLAELVQLRVLQMAENKISTIPFEAIAKLPLTDIIASKNILSGTLIPGDIAGFSNLRVLNVANNSLTAFSDHHLDMPNLQQLCIDCNRITSIPDITSWKSLLTITAEDNKLSELPEGFTLLTSLRNANFTGNDLTRLDERIALMENLGNLQIANNPLRDRKFLTMVTEDIKHDLRARLGPEFGQSSEDTSPDGSNDSADCSASIPDSWKLNPGGILDCSSTQIVELNEADLEAANSKNDIRSLVLDHNLLASIPTTLSILASTLNTLDLSNNKLGSEPQSNSMSLPYLKSLNISSNNLTSSSILDSFSAPSLAHLDLSCNRLTSLPRFRTQFPELITVVASDNSISELDVEAVRGLRALDVSRNDIGSLPPQLGLLGDELRSLEVGGNTFRVPRYTILEKGTEAVLAWLKDKIPVESVPSETDSVD
jgi:Leucine-rich repeat (LRR) protein